jgi:acetyl esterase/lipase
MNPRLLFALVTFSLAGAPLFAADESPVVLLWPNGAPGSEGQTGDEIILKGDHVTNIHHPSLTLFLPAKDKNTGAAVIIAPGGSHEFLWINYEGHAIARWLADHGVAGIVLKYRLSADASAPKGKSPYTLENEQADADRAVRVVRHHAKEWGINSAAVGFLGISAGGEDCLLATLQSSAGTPTAADPVEHESSRPDFLALLYPGGLDRDDLAPTSKMPPVFLVAGYRDRFSELAAEYYVKCKHAGVNAELHLYAGAGHGFGLRDVNPPAVNGWIARLDDWLVDRKFAVTVSQSPPLH